ncbi:phage holin family protein [Amycolatopsis anabasis]|uniref:phage holin family protein n=1 Tax=Amycolatopsis anabasis TaxID=1840409 RepID=UPI00131B5B93|nr:phage holin family protein [Amycolatopsis anabasis]
MTGVGDDSRGRRFGGPWLVVGLILAVAATLALVLSNDMRWLRLGIVAALWAALIGAFLAVKYRKHASSTEETVAQAQAVYELELEREIAARREYELEIEAETRDRVEADSREELEALRTEVLALRESLQSLFGGEVLYERVALTAQATRMRRLEQQRIVQGANGKPAHPQIGAGNTKTEDLPERPTELIDRVIEQSAPEKRRKSAVETQLVPEPPRAEPKRPEPKRAEPHRPEPHRPDSRRPEPQRAEKPADGGPPTRRVPVGEPAPGSAAARAAQALGQARNETTRVQRKPAEGKPAAAQQKPLPQRPAQPAPERPRGEPELTRPAMDRVERGRAAASMPPPPRKPEPAKPAREPEPPSDLAQGIDPDWKPSWENGGRENGNGSRERDRPVRDLSAAFGSRTGLTPVTPPADPGSRNGITPVNPPADPGSRPGFAPVPPADSGSRSGFPPADQGSRPGMPPVRPPADPGSRPGFAPVTPPAEAGRRARPSEPERPAAEISPPFSAPPPAPKPKPEPEPEPEAAGRHGAHRAADDRASESRPAINPTLPESVRQLQAQGRPGGRRRRAADDEPAAPEQTPSAGGGRRRRPDGEPPSWQAGNERNGSRHSSGADPAAANGHRTTGSHAKPDAGESNGRRSAAAHGGRGEESGSHTAGRSVTELLAAHGGGETTPRRRRRAED